MIDSFDATDDQIEIISHAPSAFISACPGAGKTRVLSLIVGHALRVCAVAALVGLIAARGVSKLMAALLFEVSPADPQTYVVVTSVLMVVAVVAAYAPARRAATVDPMVALRQD